MVCQEENRKFIGIELNSAYVALAISRLQKNSLNLARINAA
ncbi:MAG: site-specific DNA-methyltransferase [Deltaproteobacteria bacterium]|nr:site-specific DNA-methyltransferase [Deltaproteobacteria bacterium]